MIKGEGRERLRSIWRIRYKGRREESPVAVYKSMLHLHLSSSIPLCLKSLGINFAAWISPNLFVNINCHAAVTPLANVLNGARQIVAMVKGHRIDRIVLPYFEDLEVL